MPSLEPCKKAVVEPALEQRQLGVLGRDMMRLATNCTAFGGLISDD